MKTKLIGKKERFKKSFLFNRIFLVFLGFFLISISFCLWKSQESKSLSQMYLNTLSKARTYSSETKIRYQNIYNALDRLAKRGVPPEATNNDEWGKDAVFYMDTFEGIKGIMWINKNLQICRVVPLQDNESYLYQNVNEMAVNLSDFSLLIPVFDYGTELKGFILGTINIGAFISPVIKDIKKDYMLQILNEGLPVFTSNNWNNPKEEFTIKKIISLRNAEIWNLYFAPTNELLNSEKVNSRRILLFYLLISFIALIAVYFAQNYNERSQLLERSKENLQKSQTLLLEAQEQLIHYERKQGEEKLKKTMDATLQTISRMIEVRDPYTAGHQLRVAQLSVVIAKELNLSLEQTEGLRIAALIHDIGKIGIPTEILSKPTKLTDIEFSLIKEHPQIGYDILKTVDFSYPVANIVLQHHERLNGSGYPNQIKGDEILLEAKIICVADVVEAMSSHRPYRPALGIDKALEEISQNKGILYDLEVVNACLKLFKEKGFEFKS